MKELLFCSLLILSDLACPAQSKIDLAPPFIDPFAMDTPEPKKIYSNEIGVRYGAQIFVGRGQHTDFQQISIDYARYNYNNIGFRTGVELSTAGIANKHIAVPLQFSWRTGRQLSAYRQVANRPEDRGRYDGWYYYPPTEQPTSSSLFMDILFSILPTSFEMHTGFTPGMICGQFGRSPYNIEPFANQRFSATFDIGGRFMIPIWRFNLLFDMTYHCYLTDTFRNSPLNNRISRSFVGFSGGLSFNF